MAKKVPMRLKYLRVAPSKASKSIGPCAEEMQNLLACWRLGGVDASGCVAAVTALAACSSTHSKSASASQLKPSVNYVLNKMFHAR